MPKPVNQHPGQSDIISHFKEVSHFNPNSTYFLKRIRTEVVLIRLFFSKSNSEVFCCLTRVSTGTMWLSGFIILSIPNPSVFNRIYEYCYSNEPKMNPKESILWVQQEYQNGVISCQSKSLGRFSASMSGWRSISWTTNLHSKVLSKY